MKAVKTAALVIGAAALIATGVGAAAGIGLGFTAAAGIGSVAAGIGVSTTVLEAAALAGAVGLAATLEPKTSQGGSQTKWKGDPFAGVPYVMGRTLVAGNLVARRGSGGDNTYEQFVTVLSIGPIRSIEAIFANRTTVTFDGSGTAIGTYNDLIWYRYQLGACPEPAALSPARGAFPGWDGTCKLSGLAATLVTMEYDAKGHNQLTTEPSMSQIVNGVYVYDPRLDSTYPGGSGACRAFDEATYVWSEDPHLHGLTWALGRYHNGKRVAGIGTGSAVPGGTVRGVDVASFVEGANLNAARGWKLGGQVVTRPDAPWNSLKAMLQAGGAEPALVGGTIVCINKAPRVSLATITPADIAGTCTFSGTQPRRSRINGVVPMYRSEAHDWEMVSAEAVIVPDYVTVDGDERTKEIQYPLVQQVTQAAQLARYAIEDAREAGPGSIPLKPWWLNYRIGDCVTFAPEDGFSPKVMITGSSLEAQTGIVTYTVKTETDGKHAFALGQTGTAPPTASIAYSTAVDAPAATEWTLTGTALTDNGASIPALVFNGDVGNASADAALFDYRVYAAGLGDEDGWIGGTIAAAAITTYEVTSVTPGTQYQGSVRYRVRGVTGPRLILGPVTAGQLAVSRAAYTVKSYDPTNWTLSSPDSASITIPALTATLDDGTIGYVFPAGSVTGLTAGTYYAVFQVRSSGVYFAEAYGSESAAQGSSANIFLGWQATQASDGTFPPVSGGGGGGGGTGPRPVLV